MSPAAGQNGPNSKINNFVLKLKFQISVHMYNHKNPPREWDQSCLIVEAVWALFLQTLMYDIPLLSNLIFVHPLIYVSFHSSYWCQTETGRREAIRKLDIRVYYFKKLNAIKLYCFVFNLNYHNYPHFIKFCVRLILIIMDN